MGFNGNVTRTLRWEGNGEKDEMHGRLDEGWNGGLHLNFGLLKYIVFRLVVGAP